jgi:uncharacterized membrane protein YfcA
VDDISALSIAALSLTALVAGLIDAIAGGGGLLTVPALLAAGLPPHAVFGTNKGAAVFGSGTALLRFARAGLIDGSRVKTFFVCGILGSLLGASALLAVEPSLLRPVVLVLLVAAAVAVSFVRVPEAPVRGVGRLGVRAAAIALGLGAYDGFFGPGTGTFLIVALVLWLQFDLRGASANAKVVNFASNLAALALFALQGKVLWRVSLPMAAANMLGGALGAQLAIKGGNRLVRVVVLAVVVALVLKLSMDMASA